MNVRELFSNIQVNYYGNVKYNTSKWDVTLMDWHMKYTQKYKDTIERIREINKTDEKKAKSMKSDLLPCITITGHFPSYRQVQRADRFNPIICLDIDKNDNPQIEDWEALKNKLITELPYIALTSLSCRGEGIYCYVYYDINLDFKKVWYSLERDLTAFGVKIDKNCKDITRLRFISYDEHILVRKEVEMYSKEYDKEAEYQNTNFKPDSELNEDDQFIFLSVYHLINYCNYRANDYHDWLQDGFRLATLGQMGELLFMMLSQKSAGYNQQEARDKFRECQRTTKKQKNSIAYYFARLKEIYGAGWKKTVLEKTVINNIE